MLTPLAKSATTNRKAHATKDFQLLLRCAGSLPCHADVNADLRGAFKAVSAKPKKILGVTLFGSCQAKSSTSDHHGDGQLKIPYTYIAKQILPTQPWQKIKRSLCDLNGNKNAGISPFLNLREFWNNSWNALFSSYRAPRVLKNERSWQPRNRFC